MINGHDKDKSVDIAYAVRDGKVVLHWHQPTNHLVFEPPNAFEFGERIARCAHEAKFGTVPPDGNYLAQQVRARLTEALRDRMIVRATLMARSMLHQERSPEYVAAQIVDSIFAEVG